MQIQRGVVFMVAAMVVFSIQDGISKLLAADAPAIFIVMIRYWAFAAFVMALSTQRPGGMMAQAQTRHPLVQVCRGLMLVTQIVLITASFVALGLAETHAIMAIHPLITAALGAFILREHVAWPQWCAIVAGFAGILIILQPGTGVLNAWAFVPLLCAGLFAGYAILTRWVGADDTAGVSFFYTGVAGAVGITLIGPFYWSELSATAWMWMAVLCVTGALGHYLLIRAYDVSQAAVLQPYAYLQLVMTSVMGVALFSETLDAPLIIGSMIVVAAGLFALNWQRRQTR